MRQRELLALIHDDDGLRALWDELAPCDRDSAHDRGHLLRVARWTLRLVEGACSPRLCVAAALLHDVVNVPKDAPDRAEASARSAEVAAKHLQILGFSFEEIEQATDAILNHSFSRGQTPQTALGRALQDADRLEALGAVGLWRTAAVGNQMGAAFAHLTDPWAQARARADRVWSVDHFFTKLFLLPDQLHHAEARAEAHRRVALMRTFLQHLGDEIDAPLPESWRSPGEPLALGVARRFARSLDEEDYEVAIALLSRDCLYQCRDNQMRGPAEIIASYQASAELARASFDGIAYESAASALTATEARIDFADHLRRGERHLVFRCWQRLKVDEAGLIVEIEHFDLEGQRDALKALMEDEG
jgi:uncharacterized protein